LAQVCHAAGKWNEAKTRYEALNAESSDTYFNILLRECLLELGEYERARTLAEKIDAGLNRFDPADLSTMSSHAELVELNAACGQTETAATATLTLSQVIRKRIPSGHPRLADEIDVAANFVLLATDLSLVDEPNPAALAGLDKLLDEAEQICRKRLGDDHPWVPRTMLLKAKLAGARGDWLSAARLSGQAVDLLAARFSGDHTWLLEAKHVLARDNFRLDALAEAERLLREVLAVREKQLPPLHADVFETRLDLATTLLAQDNLTGAKALVQEMLAELAKTVPDGGRRAARAELVLGMCLTAEKQFDEAQRVLIKSQTALSQIYGDSHPRTRRAIEQRAKLYLAWDKPQQAAEMRRLLDRK
jgi:tetratricopeptide (TPR) repeat protein